MSTSICPSYPSAAFQYPADLIETRKKQIPLRRIGHVDELASACLYLATPNAGFVTGQCIHVNGGQFMY